jgi:hypothetical protein
VIDFLRGQFGFIGSSEGREVNGDWEFGMFADCHRELRIQEK